jgi:hypothetical protein
LAQKLCAKLSAMQDTRTYVEHSEESTSLHQAIVKYARQHAGTEVDLDPDLEAAAIDHLII